MKKILTIFNTLRYLRFKQIYYQFKHRLIKPKYSIYIAHNTRNNYKLVQWIEKRHCYKDNSFSFINIESSFKSWNYTNNGMLWAYNLNYMDWLGQSDMSYDEGAKWIDKFIDELPKNIIGLDPYPIALRGINWIKFISLHYDSIDKKRMEKWNNSLYSQYKLLDKKLEYHLLGNHLLEDAYSLYIASIYFEDQEMYKKASGLLFKELNEQILKDGSHYEQSPMYHIILLDRLLDCYNISYNNTLFGNQKKDIEKLRNYGIMMLGHLDNIIYKDKTFPILNDTAEEIAPLPIQIFDYATRLGLIWNNMPLKESGYRKMTNGRMEAIIDIGNITASYQPGHSHADTFNYELRIDGKPFVVDTGISTYNKTERRQYERSTEAHNCVVINNKNSSEVWGGFRVGKRCKSTILNDEINNIKAYHTGYKNKCYRTFKITEDSFIIEDFYDGNAVSYIHLAPNANIEKVKIEGAKTIKIHDSYYSTEYNRLIPNKTIAIYFNGTMSYRIS